MTTVSQLRKKCLSAGENIERIAIYKIFASFQDDGLLECLHGKKKYGTVYEFNEFGKKIQSLFLGRIEESNAKARIEDARALLAQRITEFREIKNEELRVTLISFANEIDSIINDKLISNPKN